MENFVSGRLLHLTILPETVSGDAWNDSFRMREEGRGSCRQQLEMLSEVLERYDPVLHHHLRHVGASDCVFAYRMLLVMLRRELQLPEVPLLRTTPAHAPLWRGSSLWGQGMGLQLAALGQGMRPRLEAERQRNKPRWRRAVGLWGSFF